MSFWGFKVGQSDDYEEAKDNFFRLYDSGKEIDMIICEILGESSIRNSNIDNEKYFALANCLWQCGEQNHPVFNHVKNLIESNSDIQLWRSLEVEESIIQKRQKELLKFLGKISSPVTNIRKRKKPDDRKYIQSIQKGNVLLYQTSSLCGYVLVLEYIAVDDDDGYYLLAISEEPNEIDHSLVTALNARVYTTAWFFSQTLCIPGKFTLLGNITIARDFNGYAGLKYSDRSLFITNGGEKSFLKRQDRRLIYRDVSMKDLL